MQTLGPLWSDGSSAGLLTGPDSICRFTPAGIEVAERGPSTVLLPWDQMAGLAYNAPRKGGLVWQIPDIALIHPRTTNDERPPTVHLKVTMRGAEPQGFILGRPAQAPFSFLESEVLDATFKYLNTHRGLAVLGDAAAMETLIPKLRACRTWITPWAWTRTQALLSSEVAARTA
jgi:hypothetical protein